jgi:hypothetical protein
MIPGKLPGPPLLIVAGGRPRGRAVVQYTGLDDHPTLNPHPDLPFIDGEEIPVSVVKQLPPWYPENAREPLGEEGLPPLVS